MKVRLPWRQGQVGEVLPGFQHDLRQFQPTYRHQQPGQDTDDQRIGGDAAQHAPNTASSTLQ